MKSVCLTKGVCMGEKESQRETASLFQQRRQQHSASCDCLPRYQLLQGVFLPSLPFSLSPSVCLCLSAVWINPTKSWQQVPRHMHSLTLSVVFFFVFVLVLHNRNIQVKEKCHAHTGTCCKCICTTSTGRHTMQACMWSLSSMHSIQNERRG